MNCEAGPAVVVGLLLLLCAWLTVDRLAVWQSPLTLWADAVTKAPQRPRPWVNYGVALSAAGETDQAIAAYQRARTLATDPRRGRYRNVSDQTIATNNLAAVLARHGDGLTAVALWTQLMAEHPTYAAAYFNRGVYQARHGACQAAQADFDRAYALGRAENPPVARVALRCPD